MPEKEVNYMKNEILDHTYQDSTYILYASERPNRGTAERYGRTVRLTEPFLGHRATEHPNLFLKKLSKIVFDLF